MNRTDAQEPAISHDAGGATSSVATNDAWQRRFGVPWERVERAVRAVSDRAVAASRRRFADLNASLPASEARPG